MNEPKRADSYRLVEGERKCEWKDSANEKMPNSGTLTINKEDHTMGNLVRMQLLRDKQVKFAGYIHPHPLIHKIELRVQTMDRALSTPMQALENALSDLNQEFTGLKSKFQQEVRRVQEEQAEREYR
ncbi:dna-directed rna polymerase ii subunit rpb11-a-like [Nannochloropsis oceanica]